jgi:hypothetical protein
MPDLVTGGWPKGIVMVGCTYHVEVPVCTDTAVVMADEDALELANVVQGEVEHINLGEQKQAS